MFEILGFSASRFSQIVPSCPLTTEVFGGDNALTSFTSSRKTPSHKGRLSLGVVVVLAAQGVDGAEDGEVGDHTGLPRRGFALGKQEMVAMIAL